MRTCSVIFLVVMAAAMTGCGSVRTVTVERVRVDTLRHESARTDTLYVRDSVAVMSRGDTVFVDKVRTVFRSTVVRDTLYRSRTDTIPQVVEVERRLTAWQKFRLSAFYWLAAVAAIVVGVVISRINKLIK